MSQSDEDFKRTVLHALSGLQDKVKALETADSAPGPDRCKYSRLRSLDPDGRCLASFFNCCLRLSTVPSIWARPLW